MPECLTKVHIFIPHLFRPVQGVDKKMGTAGRQ